MTPGQFLLFALVGSLVAFAFLRRDARPREDVLFFRAYAIGMALWAVAIMFFDLPQQWRSYPLLAYLIALLVVWLLAKRRARAV